MRTAENGAQNASGRSATRVADAEERLRKSILYNPDPDERETQLGLLGDLGDARAALEAEVAELRSRLQAASDGTEAPADQAAPAATQYLTEELQSVLTAAQESAARIVERAKAEADRSVGEAKAAVETELAESRTAAERELAEARMQHERLLAEDRLAVEQELSAARAAQEQEMSTARAAQDQEMSAARASAEEELGRARDEAAQDAARVRSGAEEEAKAALFAAREEAERIRAEAAAAAEQERSAIDAERRWAREALDRDLEASRADLEAMQAEAVKFEGWRTRMTGVLGELGQATEGQRAKIDEVPDRIREALAPAMNSLSGLADALTQVSESLGSSSLGASGTASAGEPVWSAEHEDSAAEMPASEGSVSESPEREDSAAGTPAFEDSVSESPVTEDSMTETIESPGSGEFPAASAEEPPAPPAQDLEIPPTEESVQAGTDGARRPDEEHEVVNKAAHEIDWSDLQGEGGRGVRWGEEAVEDVRRQLGWDSRQTA
jgi:hypothetical protein